MYFIGHISYIVTVIYSCPLSNYLREGKDEGFDGFGLNRFGGGPEGGPGGSIDARGRFFGVCFFGIAGGTDFFGLILTNNPKRGGCFDLRGLRGRGRTGRCSAHRSLATKR